MFTKRSSVFFITALICALAASGGVATAAECASSSPSAAGPWLCTVSYAPAHVGSRAVTFRPAGVSPATLRHATLRLGGKRRTVRLAYVKHALSITNFIRLRQPTRLLDHRDHHRRGAKSSSVSSAAFLKRAQHMRLELVYRRPTTPIPSWGGSRTENQADGQSAPSGSGQEPQPTPEVEGLPETGQEPEESEEPPESDPEPQPEPEEPEAEPSPPEPPARPPTFYVSSTGSDSNPGTQTRPFLSLDKAFRSASPGETVKVEGGVYTAPQEVRFDSTKAAASEPVTFVATENAHFVVPKPTNSFFTKIKASNITFQGPFEFDYLYVREDTSKMSNITFQGTWIHHLTEGGHVTGLNLYNNRMGPNNLWPSTGASRTGETGPDDILNLGIERSCESPAQCFSWSAEDLNIVGNSFDGAYHSWNGSHSDCIQFTVGQSGHIAGNTFQNCQSETLIVEGAIGPLENIMIENNYLGRPLDSTDPYPIQIGPCTNCAIRFNSVPSTGSLLYPLDANAGVGPSAGSNARIYGNIAGSYDGGQCSHSKTRGWEWSYNLFLGSGGTCGSNSTATSTIPYADQSTLDLSISPGSAAAGLYRGSAPAPTTDINGTPRPVSGGFPDVGAYEAG